MSADESGKAHEGFLLFLLAGQANFFGVDNDNEIAGVAMSRVNHLLFAAQEIRGFDRDAAEHLVFGVNDPPLARDFVGFSRKRLHLELKGHESYEQ